MDTTNLSPDQAPASLAGFRRLVFARLASLTCCLEIDSSDTAPTLLLDSDFAIAIGGLGDVVTQDLGRILASVSGGDVSGLTALIENEQANEYVRALAMEGMVSLATTGRRTRDEVMGYFLLLFQKLEQKPGAQCDVLGHSDNATYQEMGWSHLLRQGYFFDGVISVTGRSQ